LGWFRGKGDWFKGSWTGVTTIAGILVVDVVVDSRLMVLRLVMLKLISGALVEVKALIVRVSVGFTTESVIDMVTPLRIFVNEGVKLGLGLLLIWSAFLSSFSFLRISTGASRQFPLILTLVGGVPKQAADHWITIT
jgi:hypothetical protein